MSYINPTLLLLKNLIETKELKKAYLIKDDLELDNSIKKSLTHFDFGSALLQIDNHIFNELDDIEFENEEIETDLDIEFDDSQNFETPDYDREFFNAMTDGQMGDYDDFKDNGGNIDDVDTWSRG